MKIKVNGKPITLTNKQFLVSAGEANIILKLLEVKVHYNYYMERNDETT